MDDNSEFWRAFINSLPIPDEEEEEVDTTKFKDASVLRLRLDIYLLQPIDEEGKAYMVTGNQRLEDMGVMTINEALEIIRRRNRKNS